MYILQYTYTHIIIYVYNNIQYIYDVVFLNTWHSKNSEALEAPGGKHRIRSTKVRDQTITVSETVMQSNGMVQTFWRIFSENHHHRHHPSIITIIGQLATRQAQALRVGARRLAEAPPRMLRPKDPFRCRPGFRKKMWKKKQLKAVVNQHSCSWKITIESIGKYRHLHVGE